MASIAIGSSLTGPKGEAFKITDFLGRGGFGEVYRAVGESSGAVMAVKLLPVSSLPTDVSKVALLNEIRAAQQVTHPNVIRVLHVNDGSNSLVGPHVFMEYVSGGTLARLLRGQAQSNVQIPLNRAIEMMIDIAQGARAINGKLIHRDIKPDNVLIEGAALKIGDFGISKFVDESTRLQTFKGGQHIAYMAPEGWQNQPNTFKLDVYSVGLVFYQILTLKHPLIDKVKDTGNFLDWEKAHLYEQCGDVRTLRSDVPVSIAQLVNRMVSKRPSERPGWDETLNILSRPETRAAADHPSVKAAVEAVISRKQKEEEEALKVRRQQTEREKQLALYQYSCDSLLEKLKPVVDQFNRESQHGQITSDRPRGFSTYHIPSGHSITIHFFEPKMSGPKIRGGELIGGGWIGISEGRSANLVLLKDGPDDLYGRWLACEIGIMALVDARKLLGRFGLTERTVLPFGFRDADFYDQMRYAVGTLHAFTYNFIDDVGDFFAQLLLEACK
jgi:serine/threonine protein kinase